MAKEKENKTYLWLKPYRVHKRWTYVMHSVPGCPHILSKWRAFTNIDYIGNNVVGKIILSKVTQCSFSMSSDVSTSMALTEALLTLIVGVWGQEGRCDPTVDGNEAGESESPMVEEEIDSGTWGDSCIIPCKYAETLAVKVGELEYVEEMGLVRELVNTGDRGAMLGVSCDLAVWRSLRSLWLDLVIEWESAFHWWIKVKRQQKRC